MVMLEISTLNEIVKACKSPKKDLFWIHQGLQFIAKLLRSLLKKSPKKYPLLIHHAYVMCLCPTMSTWPCQITETKTTAIKDIESQKQRTVNINREFANNFHGLSVLSYFDNKQTTRNQKNSSNIFHKLLEQHISFPDKQHQLIYEENNIICTCKALIWLQTNNKKAENHH